MKPNIGKGDKGKTNIIGCNLDKTHPIIGLIGEIDVLNSFIGLSRSINKYSDIDKVLKNIQNDLFVISSQLAGSKKIKIKETSLKKLEKYILNFEKELKPLSNFIYPSGSLSSTVLHVARSICREVEREAFLVNKKIRVPQKILSYLNRLSDVLFTIARVENARSMIKDEEWNV